MFGRKQQRKRRIRYAVIGAGRIAQAAVLPAFQSTSSTSKLVALVSGDAEKRRLLSQRYAIPHSGGYAELEALFRRAEVDAAYIATPTALHREYTERAARAGVHVLCEVPMAPTSADCLAMIEACRSAGVRLMIAYRLHFEETSLRALELAQSGYIGTPRLFTSVLSQPLSFDGAATADPLGARALYELGVYPINAARHLLRAEPVLVSASVPPHERVNEGTLAAGTLVFEGGRIAQFCVGFMNTVVSSYRLLGEAGELLVEPAYDYSDGLAYLLVAGEHRTEHRFTKRDQFAAEIVAFSRSLLEQQELEPSGEEGLADVRVLEALVESARSGQSMSLPHFERTVQPTAHQEIHIPPSRVPPLPLKAPAPHH